MQCTPCLSKKKHVAHLKPFLHGFIKSLLSFHSTSRTSLKLCFSFSSNVLCLNHFLNVSKLRLNYLKSLQVKVGAGEWGWGAVKPHLVRKGQRVRWNVERNLVKAPKKVSLVVEVTFVFRINVIKGLTFRKSC